VADVLLEERKDGVATLTLNRPEARNALSRELRAALVEALERLSDDDEIGAVILTGTPPAFCAGLDLKELAGESDGEGRRALGGADVVGALEGFDRPVIGAINGVAITGGFELALACDVLVASRTARFADTHARVGILPGWGLSVKLPRLVGIHRAKELSFTGNFLSAEEAAAWGLVNRVVEPEALLPTCDRLARDMLSCVPEALRRYKRLIDDGFARGAGKARELERKRSAKHARRTFSAEAVRARREDIQARGRDQTR
jgi:enoyl-CoA hydratase